jgi:Cytochrome P460
MTAETGTLNRTTMSIRRLSALAASCAAFLLCSAATAPAPASPDAPQYDAEGRLIPPTDFREWVFLSSGVDMSYSETPGKADAHTFDNVFAPSAAYASFKRTGVWPDKTVLVLENRSGRSKGSINRQGLFQTGDVTGLEVHVKDSARFKGDWGFFVIRGQAPAGVLPHSAACYACHEAHGAADTTFVQFYPTLLPIATRLGTLSPAYQAEAK